jgi:2-keto-4-pentenoate hydratase/2-oxohepta-3-ene-1,7-dioic acid hydratase in catechol pathway
MQLCTFEHEGEERIGADWEGCRIIDLGMAHSFRLTDEPFPKTMLDLLRGGDEAMDLARQAFEQAQARRLPVAHEIGRVRLRAPIPRPGKILCSGINYRGHLEENPGAKLPESPFFFSKLPSAVIGPGDPIVHPKLTRQLDYEVELAVVIGRTIRRVGEREAMEAVAGYTILHDVSARDVQFKDNQITLGKNFDTFAPMGPSIVTADEVPDPGDLRLVTAVNGRVLQDGSTRDWVFPLPRLLAALSAVMTLEPGDVVSTGTPAGVGVFRKPQVFLRPGDVVVLEVEGIGRLENPVVAEE